jgi:hypothetical protein
MWFVIDFITAVPAGSAVGSRMAENDAKWRASMLAAAHPHEAEAAVGYRPNLSGPMHAALGQMSLDCSRAICHMLAQPMEQPDMRKIRLKRRQGGPGRPFPKGFSGNPAGRPAKRIEERAVEVDVRKLARQTGAEAIEKLVEIMRGTVTIRIGDENVVVPVAANTQLGAAEALLDRGYGRPGQSIELSSMDNDPPEDRGISACEVIQRRLAAITDRLRDDGHPLLIEP